MPCLFSLLSAGFSVIVKAGCSINDLLSQEIGISQTYIDDRIQTIFLNGKAVDDSRSATLEEGAILALSAAMPGMVGSTFRKSGVFASMRSQISHVTDPSVNLDSQIEVKLKLFNLIAKELGPAIFQNGIFIDGKLFQNFLLHNSENLKTACISIHLNDEKTDIARLLKRNWGNEQISLQITPEKSS
ncbi:MAG: hypothetical protein HKO68_17880 [Desulfobacterales bacterium]|nr:hypothetical protein [Desulfobacterales bacterium]